MYLKALEIQGFKSFPDKTVLNFGEDITAIVGPNGSGKSNISDAIRWVMGEQSSKALRGGKMEDVIFGGTEKRAPVGFAQVTLVLDNTAHIFPSMEEAEVAVTRRYYRSGESEYYINRQSVRLKDVTELFMDTGMGREGYSIVGQGRVDEILSTKSTDRREIFEEAAGISKFRHRKEEAERKLERTEENLVRINDKIAELELQVEPLRAQAETAKRYLVLHDELRLLEISLWLEQLETLKSGARKLETDLRAAEQQRDDARAKMDALFAENEQFGRRMQEKDMEAERLRGDAAALDGQSAEQDSAVAVLESTVRHLQENIDRAREELAETRDPHRRLRGAGRGAGDPGGGAGAAGRCAGDGSGAIAGRGQNRCGTGGQRRGAGRVPPGTGGHGNRRGGGREDAACGHPGGKRTAHGAAHGRGGGQGVRRDAAGGKEPGGQDQPPGAGGCAGGGAGRRQHHQRTHPADGGAKEKGRLRRGRPGEAHHGRGGAGQPDPPADGDGKGL